MKLGGAATAVAVLFALTACQSTPAVEEAAATTELQPTTASALKCDQNTVVEAPEWKQGRNWDSLHTNLKGRKKISAWTIVQPRENPGSQDPDLRHLKIVFQDGKTRFLTYGKGLGRMAYYKKDGSLSSGFTSPGRLHLPFPIRVGDNWDGDKLNNFGGLTYQNLNMRAVGFEPFSAKGIPEHCVLRVEGKLYSNSPTRGEGSPTERGDEMALYSPLLGIVVYRSFEYTPPSGKRGKWTRAAFNYQPVVEATTVQD